MGRTITPTYAVHLFVPGTSITPAAWDVRRNGRPTDANLTRYVRAFEQSTLPGGPNAHLGPMRVLRARVRHQRSGEFVAEYTAPQQRSAFTVVAVLVIDPAMDEEERAESHDARFGSGPPSGKLESYG
jgi:hypothetical protein